MNALVKALAVLERYPPRAPLIERSADTPEAHLYAALRGIGRINVANRLPALIARFFPNAALLRGIAVGILAEAQKREQGK